MKITVTISDRPTHGDLFFRGVDRRPRSDASYIWSNRKCFVGEEIGVIE